MLFACGASRVEAAFDSIARMDIVIRPMRRAQVDSAIELAAREGWNPGLHDATCFHAADPMGFLVAEHRDEWLR